MYFSCTCSIIQSHRTTLVGRVMDFKWETRCGTASLNLISSREGDIKKTVPEMCQTSYTNHFHIRQAYQGERPFSTDNSVTDIKLLISQNVPEAYEKISAVSHCFIFLQICSDKHSDILQQIRDNISMVPWVTAVCLKSDVIQVHFIKQSIFNSTIIQYNQHALPPLYFYVLHMTLNKLFTIFMAHTLSSCDCSWGLRRKGWIYVAGR